MKDIDLRRVFATSSPSRTARTELFRMLASNPDGLLAALCEEITDGIGFAGFCAKEGIRYGDLRKWVWESIERTQAVEHAEQARGAFNAEAVEAIGRKLAAPDVRTGVEWVDDGPAELDPKAARVAVEAFQRAAMFKDRGKFGRAVQHNHTLTVQQQHLQALRAVVMAGASARSLQSGPLAPAQAMALPQPVDAEYRVIPTRGVQAQPVEVESFSVRLPVRPRGLVNQG